MSGDSMASVVNKNELQPHDHELPEGFYLVEAVRKKRIQKGQAQYYIKWRGWPESANTWEPFQNLESCSDIIDAFEERLRTGKHRASLKRKRRPGCPGPEAPSKTLLEVAVGKIRKLKGKEEGERKAKLEAQVKVGRQTRSARRAALGQAIGIQFHNTKDNPVIIDDEEKIRRFTVEGVELNAPTYYNNGQQLVKTEVLIHAIEKVLPSVKEEQREALEEYKKKLLKKLERNAARGQE